MSFPVGAEVIVNAGTRSECKARVTKSAQASDAEGKHTVAFYGGWKAGQTGIHPAADLTPAPVGDEPVLVTKPSSTEPAPAAKPAAKKKRCSLM